MWPLGRVALVTLMALAALAVGSPLASAVELTQEESGLHCPPVTVSDHSVSGGCLFAGQNQDGFVERRGAFGIMYLCSWGFSARLNENGEGYAYQQVLTGPDCGVAPRTESDGHKHLWPLEVTGANADGTFSVELSFGISGAFGLWLCHNNDILLSSVSHTAAVLATSGTTHALCEGSSDAWLGEWGLVSAGGGVEIS